MRGLDLAVRVGELMLRCGAGAPQVEGAMAATAAAAGVDHVELDITLQSILVQATQQRGPAAHAAPGRPAHPLRLRPARRRPPARRVARRRRGHHRGGRRPASARSSGTPATTRSGPSRPPTPSSPRPSRSSSAPVGSPPLLDHRSSSSASRRSAGCTRRSTCPSSTATRSTPSPRPCSPGGLYALGATGSDPVRRERLRVRRRGRHRRHAARAHDGVGDRGRHLRVPPDRAPDACSRCSCRSPGSSSASPPGSA